MRMWRPELSVALRVGGAVVLVVLFLTASWYGVSRGAYGAFGASRAGSAGAWALLGVTRWFVLAALAGTLLSLIVTDRRIADIALVLGVLATAALFYRLLIRLPDPRAVLDVKLGGYLGLVACAALTLGAYEAPRVRTGH